MATSALQVYDIYDADTMIEYASGGELFGVYSAFDASRFLVTGHRFRAAWGFVGFLPRGMTLGFNMCVIC